MPAFTGTMFARAWATQATVRWSTSEQITPWQWLALIRKFPGGRPWSFCRAARTLSMKSLRMCPIWPIDTASMLHRTAVVVPSEIASART